MPVFLRFPPKAPSPPCVVHMTQGRGTIGKRRQVPYTRRHPSQDHLATTVAKGLLPPCVCVCVCVCVCAAYSGVDYGGDGSSRQQSSRSTACRVRNGALHSRSSRTTAGTAPPLGNSEPEEPARRRRAGDARELRRSAEVRVTRHLGAQGPSSFEKGYPGFFADYI
ncbi:hypothetical protein LZ30DRAFT_230008 [Colletotrichum cereale]|nr:hypothetical protein LZ30DRAFT_230008 [Colletotrichum cereale]